MENTQNVVQLFPNKINPAPMSFKDADELLNLITVITRKTKQKINVLNSQASYFKGQLIKTNELQTQINDELEKWSDKMVKLGLTPVSMYKVKFETADGNYYWEYPEMKLIPEV